MVADVDGRGRPRRLSTLDALYLHCRRRKLTEPFEQLAMEFGCSARTAMRAHVKFVVVARLRFVAIGNYPTVDEELYSRTASDPFVTQFPKQMVVKIDFTGFLTEKPTHRMLQRLMYCQYYKRNCFRGLVGILQSGWVFALPLMSGGIDESALVERSTLYSDLSGLLRAHREGKLVPSSFVLSSLLRFLLCSNATYPFSHGGQFLSPQIIHQMHASRMLCLSPTRVPVLLPRLQSIK
jgi:hypothetical protein